MGNKGMTLSVEILIIVFFSFAAFLSFNLLINSFIGGYSIPVYYHDIEKKAENAAREYMNHKVVDEKVVVSIDVLRENDLFDEKCNGYVIIDEPFYTAYIKCDGYKTNGYSEVLAN